MSVRTLRYNTMNQHITKSALASTDRDALAFLEAAKIYNTNQQRAIVNLVRSLKRVGLWSKMKAIYPFVGGTATSHMYNLKDPRNADAAFRLSFVGGWTHASTGATPNGTNGYADTFLIPTTNLTNNSTHISYYSRSNTSRDSVDIGMISSANVLNRLVMNIRRGNGLSLTDQYHATNNRVSATISDSRGYFVGYRNDSTTLKYFRNNTQISTTNTTASEGFANCTTKIGIAADVNAPSTHGYGNKEVAFVTIGDGLTDADATNLYNIVDLYQKQLGRAV